MALSAWVIAWVLALALALALAGHAPCVRQRPGDFDAGALRAPLRYSVARGTRGKLAACGGSNMPRSSAPSALRSSAPHRRRRTPATHPTLTSFARVLGAAFSALSALRSAVPHRPRRTPVIPPTLTACARFLGAAFVDLVGMGPEIRGERRGCRQEVSRARKAAGMRCGCSGAYAGLRSTGRQGPKSAACLRPAGPSLPRVPLAAEHRKEARRAPVSKPLRPYRMPVAL